LHCSTEKVVIEEYLYKQQQCYNKICGPNAGKLYPMAIPQLTQSGPKISLIDFGSRRVPYRGQSVLVGSTTTLAIATIFIAARLVSRVIIVRRTAWDDYCIILAWVGTPRDRYLQLGGTARTMLQI
jgi:hypothetical protein